MPPKSMIVAGVMSGTSADGVDVALVRISPTLGTPRLKLLGHRSHPYPPTVRKAVLAAMNAPAISVADLSRLHWRLGELYADAIQQTSEALNLKPTLAALHGQTIYHQPLAEKYLGRPTRTTWQLGEPTLTSHRLRIPVVSDFRPADLAAGGQGAPLVPMLDFCLFRHPTRNRILLNLGGIANLTAIPAAAALDQLLAFDTGPANMVIDALMTRHFARPYDREGRTAAKGKLLPSLLAELLRNPYFLAPPPKSCGREQFGDLYTTHLATLAPNASAVDLIATATELTAQSIRESYARFCWPHLGQRAPLARATELIIAGGGTRNRTLMARLTHLFAQLAVKILPIEKFGLESQAKEAAAFALLGWLTFHGLPGNVPSATGATHPAILGNITHA